MADYKTYLVTGGAGFIGSHYIRHIFDIHRHIRVINVDCLTYAGNTMNLKSLENNPDYIFFKADIDDKAALTSIFTKYDIDYIVNFAAETHVDRSIQNPDEFINTNIHGTLNLLNRARTKWIDGDEPLPGKKYVQISTDEVYGSLGKYGFFTEQTPLDPHSPYSASKASADLLVKAYFDTYKLPVNITRCSNNYGPNQFPEKFIPLLIDNALNGRKLPIYGDGMQIRDWLYVNDHVRAIDMVCSNGIPGEIYNIGGHNEKRNIDIAKTILKVLSGTLPDTDVRKSHINPDLIEFIEDRKGHDRRYAIDPSKIRNELGWAPETVFEDGLQLTVEWYLNNPEWVGHVTA